MPPTPTPPPRRARARRRTAAVAAALCALTGAIACNDDPFSATASFAVAADTLVVSALTGSGPGARSALLLRTAPVAAIPEGTLGGDYQLVLDIDGQGRPVIYQAQLVSTLAPRRVGIRRIEGPYDSLTTAPTGGYNTDSSLTVALGETIGVRVPQAGNECVYASRPYFFSKLVVDSVRLAQRLLFVRATTDPNCGFRSFAPGVPDR